MKNQKNGHLRSINPLPKLLERGRTNIYDHHLCEMKNFVERERPDNHSFILNQNICFISFSLVMLSFVHKNLKFYGEK